MSSPESERELARWLEEVVWDAVQGSEDSGLRTTSFAEAGLLTADEGLVLRLPGGAEFQLTIVRSREVGSRPLSTTIPAEDTRTSPATCARLLTPRSCAHEGFSKKRALTPLSRQPLHDEWSGTGYWAADA